MIAHEALRILRALADGLDPATGEKLPAAAPYQTPEIIRALYEGIQALDHVERTERRDSRLPDKTGQAWTEAEDDQLAHEFDSAMNVYEIAKVHKRTKGAIIARLVRLKKLPPTADMRVAS